MKTLRIMATILVYGPVIGMLGAIVGAIASFTEVMQTSHGIRPEVLAYRISIVVYSWTFAMFAFPIGVFLHGFVARRTGVYRRNVWRLILSSSILFCITNPVGLFLGGTTIALLFTLDTFKRMRIADRDRAPVTEAHPTLTAV